MKVPLFVPVFLICLAVGTVGGVAYMLMYGQEWKPYAFVPGAPNELAQAKGGPKGGAKGGGNEAGMFSKGGGPNARVQLAQLIAKLDQLMDAPLILTLAEDERAEFHKKLDGLDQLEDLDDQSVRMRLSELWQTTLWRAHQKTLQDAGYVPPGSARPGGGGFNAVLYADHLKSLQDKLSKAKDR